MTKVPGPRVGQLIGPYPRQFKGCHCVKNAAARAQASDGSPAGLIEPFNRRQVSSPYAIGPDPARRTAVGVAPAGRVRLAWPIAIQLGPPEIPLYHGCECSRKPFRSDRDGPARSQELTERIGDC